MATRLRAQEVAALQRALESERFSTKAAQERAKELQQALDSERSAVRALRREAASQARLVREEEAKKYNALIEQLKTKMELAQGELVAMEKESTTRALTVQFHRELQARQEEWKRDSRRQLEPLQEQLKEAQRVSLESPPQRETEALVHSLHADFHRSLHQKQEEWRRDSKSQIDALTNQLRELQRLYTDTCNKLTTTTNEAETIPKMRQEIHTLKLQNKELEEKVQMLMEVDRRKVEEFRSQHEDNVARIAELQRSARKEAFQLLEEIKSKDRMIAQLQREYHLLTNRLSGNPPVLGRSRLTSETSHERPGEPPRLCVKRPKTLTFSSDVNKRLRAPEVRKPPDPPGPDTVTTKKENDQKTNENSTTNPLEPLKEEVADGPKTSDLINSWTKKVGVETLYQLLLEEHQELQRNHHSALTRLRDEERTRSQLEDQLRESRRAEGDNAINLALAEQIQVLQDRQAELEAESQELREQNDLLEFRILELDDGGCAHSCSSYHFKSPSSRSPDTRDREIDDVSDSGVMSLPTSEDISEADFQDYKMEPNNRDVKSRLAQLCQSLENVSERISIQQALALLRHYESRLENLEATLAAMCQEATQTKAVDHLPLTNTEHAKSPSRIIATVLPFTELTATYHGKDVRDDMPLKRLLRDQDCMQESGIFEDGALMSCVLHVATQTDWTFEAPHGELGAEIRKLTQIRERIEEKGGNKRLLKSPETDPEFLTHASFKELLFYRDRVQVLEDKLIVYESRGDDQSKLLAMRLEKEVLLAAQVKHLQNTVRRLKEENRCLDEEKCEFEEAENDTRLRCQKLEVKLSALGEKKSDLQVQLQQNARTMSNLRSTLSEEERKRNEARQYAAKMEALVNRLEQQNFEMEEKEMEARYRLHTLESIVPAMVLYYLWRMLNAVRPFLSDSKTLAIHGSNSDSVLVIKSSKQDQEKHKKLRRNRQEKDEVQDSLRQGLQEIQQFLTSKQRGESVDCPNVTVDAAFLVIEELSDKCTELKERIKELELKEKVYQETLLNEDEILNKMEMDYKHQLKCAEDELLHKQAELKKAEAQIKKCSGDRELETQFQERLNQLESEILQLQEVLLQKDKEKKVLEGEQIRLTVELEEAVESLEKFKENIEKPLREEVDNHRRKVRELLGDLDMREQEKNETEEMHRKLVKELKRINHQACRELEESEVTISEMKEEVQTLEREVADLRAALNHERVNSERMLLEVGAELEARDRQIRSLGSGSLAGSLHEELLDVDAAERRVDDVSTTDVAASTTSPTARYLPTCDCQRAEQVIKEFNPNNADLDQITSAYQHSRTCRHCKNTTAVELRGILNLLQKTSPQSKMAQINHLLLLR
uniref:Janus kinase and microtubule-interacting protein C-terminal domain-containing protein n=2 Tax=Graphocephala atropunctata TaxID=36148 RepID=A0A1B6M3K9_9HEMI